jgi:hypothetical protein
MDKDEKKSEDQKQNMVHFSTREFYLIRKLVALILFVIAVSFFGAPSFPDSNKMKQKSTIANLKCLRNILISELHSWNPSKKSWQELKKDFENFSATENLTHDSWNQNIRFENYDKAIYLHSSGQDLSFDPIVHILLPPDFVQIDSEGLIKNSKYNGDDLLIHVVQQDI